MKWTLLHSSPCIHFPCLLWWSPATDAIEASWHRCACRRVARSVQRFCASVIGTWSQEVSCSFMHGCPTLCIRIQKETVSSMDRKVCWTTSQTRPWFFCSRFFPSPSRCCCRDGAAHQHAGMCQTAGSSGCQCSEMRSVMELCLSRRTFSLDFSFHLFSFYHFSSVSLSFHLSSLHDASLPLARMKHFATHRNEASTPQASNQPANKTAEERRKRYADTPITDKKQQHRLHAGIRNKAEQRHISRTNERK